MKGQLGILAAMMALTEGLLPFTDKGIQEMAYAPKTKRSRSKLHGYRANSQRKRRKPVRQNPHLLRSKKYK